MSYSKRGLKRLNYILGDVAIQTEGTIFSCGSKQVVML